MASENSEGLFEALDRASLDGVLVVNGKGRVVHANARFVEIWRVPRELVASNDDARLLEHALGMLKDQTGFIAKVEELYVHPDHSSHDEIELVDGRTLDRYSSPLESPDGKWIGRAWFFRDRTNHVKERNEAQLTGHRLKATLHALPDLLFVLDSDGRIQDFHAPEPELLHMPPERFLNRTVSEVLPEPAAKVIMGAVADAVEHGRHSGATYDLDTPAGRRCFELWAVTTRLSDKVSITVLVRDITDRRDVERALAKSEHHYRQLVESVGMPITHVGRDGTILLVNTASASELSAEPDEVIGKKLSEIFPDHARQFEARVRVLDETGQSASFVDEVQLSSGSRWFSSDLHPIGGETDNFESVLIFSRDITEQVEAESRMRELAGMVEASNDAFIGVDISGAVMGWNRAAELLFGYTAAEMLGEPLARLTPPALRDETPAISDILSGAHRTFDTVRLTKDGREVPVSLRLSPLIDRAGNARGTYAIVSDISPRIAHEKALLRAMRAKDEFLANMSHELRTPLHSILGVAEALQEGVYGELEEGQARSLDTVEASGRHLLSLINDVLDLSRLEARRLQIDLHDVQIHDLCSEVIRVVRPQASAASLRLKTSSDGATEIVQADPRRIRQILLNLLSNAIKFTPAEGSVSLDVRTAIANDELWLEVTDTGPGIAPEQLELLFTPFVQLDGDPERRGSGLGLALSMELAALHGGRIDVSSEVGRGSKFSFVLPLKRPSTEPAVVPRTAPQPNVLLVEDSLPAARLIGAKAPLILIVDDTPTNVVHVRDYLRDRGMRVTTATDGLTGIEMAISLGPDVVLMDIQMPGLDGLEAIRRLRSDPRTQDIRIAAVTALARAGDGERCLEAGANSYLPKPYSLAELNALLTRLLMDTAGG